jgi:purine nucleosidase
MSPRPIIIDCDPGQDDAVALLLALASPDDLDVLGITCVAGNVPLALTQRNARIIVELSGRLEVPVYVGCPRPILRPLVTAERVHGKSGLDGYDRDEPTLPLADGHAVEFIIATCLAAGDRSVTLCPLGPMTNIAQAIVQQPAILPKLREVAFMGGAALGPGNITASAEFNIYTDPHAAQVVLSSGVPLTMFGLDVTHKAITTPARREAIRAIGTPVSEAVSGMLAFYDRHDIDRYGMPGGPLHDPCVIAYLLRPDLFDGKECHVAIETEAALTMGRTVADWWGVGGAAPNCRVINRIDADGFYALIVERLARL